MTDYYSLPGSQRWMDSSNPNEIGGRATDVSLIADWFYRRIREIFPINDVPPDLVTQIESLKENLEISEQGIESLIDVISYEVVRRGMRF